MKRRRIASLAWRVFPKVINMLLRSLWLTRHCLRTINYLI